MLILENKIGAAVQVLFEGIERVLLAVSGGADSAAMAHVLAELRKRGRLSCGFVIGHVNHCLRGDDSDADEAFVRELGESLAIPVAVRAVDVKAVAKELRLSIETAGRNLRLKTLAAMAAEYECGCIAMAHHKDDLAETMIHRLMRGTGFRGLCGIRPVSAVDGAAYVRPMLAVRRTEILRYCQEHGIPWRQDKSNSDLRFTRNRIRHRLLPQLRADADITESLAKLAAAAQGLQCRLDEILKNTLEQLPVGEHSACRVCFNQEKLNACSPWVFYEIIRRGIVTVGGGLRDYSRSHFDAIAQMAARSKAKADFPGPLEVVVEKGTVSIQRKECNTGMFRQDEDVKLRPGDTVEFGSWKIASRLLRADEVEIKRFLKTKDSFVEWFDADKVSGALVVRQRRDGDRFWPIGAKGEKKVARFLQDGQLGATTKKKTFIISDSEKILWVAPIRMSDRAKITSKTLRLLEIRISGRL